MSRPKGKTGSSGVNNRDRDISSAIVRPLRKGNVVYPLDVNPLPEQDGDNLTLNLEEELARLELETLDDFVYNALGSFNINTDIEQNSGTAPQKTSNNSKYTILSPTELLAEGDPDPEVAGTSSDKTPKPSYRDSGISSGTDYPTSPNVFVIEHSLVSLGSGEGLEGDGSDRVNDMEKGSSSKDPRHSKPVKAASVDKKAAPPQQPNGSVGGPSTAPAPPPTTSKATNRTKIQHESSIYGKQYYGLWSLINCLG